MISLLAATAIQTSRVVEWLEPTAPFVTIQAVVKLPELNTKQRNLLRMVAGCLGEETRTYSGSQIFDIASRTGSRLRAEVMDDHIRVGMDVVPADTMTGISMVSAVLRESAITEASLQRISTDLTYRRLAFWRQAVDLRSFQPPKYDARELNELLAIVFRPENVWLGVGGKVAPGAATEKWEELTSAWQMARPPRTERPSAEPIPPPKINGQVSILDFQGSPFLASDAAFSTKLLALTAIGTGKGASLWRIAREKLVVSYRQEALLSPVSGGLMPRLLIAHAGKEELEKVADTIRAELLSDISAWTDDDKKRAIGMAESYLVRGGDFNPLYLCPGRPVSKELSDQVFLRTYWQMKTGSRWNPHQLVGRLGFVELAELKETASEIVAKSAVRIYPAN